MEPRRIDLPRARREAKALLRAARDGDPDALARVRAAAPATAALRLAAAQLAVAREHGARSWPDLVGRVERAALAAELHRAVAVDHDPAATARLLAAGARPRDDTLRAAAGVEDPACLGLLLAAGAPARPLALALAEALSGDHREHAELILDRLPAGSGARAYALHWALGGAGAAASAATIRALVDRGADLEAVDGSGRTPYAVAARAGRPDLAELLVELGARPRVEPVDALLGACLAGDRAAARQLAADHPEALDLVRSAHGGALADAARDGREESVAILLDLGVPVDARGGRDGDTALQAARAGGHDAVVALLLARGADPAKPRVAHEPRPRAGEPDYGELAWAAEAAYLRALRALPDAEVRPLGDGFAVMTGADSNSENGVVASRLGDDADAQIAATLAWFAGRGVPAAWLLGDPVAPAGLRDRLAAAGAEPERSATVMGARIAELDLAHPPPAGVAIAPAPDPRPGVTRLVARRDGDEIGHVTTLVAGTTAYGLALEVEPVARRAGVGRALVAAAAREAAGAGAEVAVLSQTPESIPFHRLLGFVLRPYPADRVYYLPAG